MNFYYVNSKNEKLELSDYPYLFQSGDLFDYSWTYDSVQGTSNKATNFRKDLQTYSVRIAVLPSLRTEKEQRRSDFYQAVNHLISVFDTDILNQTQGRLYTEFGEYLPCNIVSSKKTDWNIGQPFLFNEFTVLAPNPWWITESLNLFRKGTSKVEGGKKYAYQYPYRYPNSVNNQAVINEHFYDSNFLLTIYGEASNPQIKIGGNVYQVNVIIESDQRLEINSSNGTIFLIHSDGTAENKFNERDKTNNVFQKIPPGRQAVSWNGQFDFDLTIYEERGEPKWR